MSLSGWKLELTESNKLTQQYNITLQCNDIGGVNVAYNNFTSVSDARELKKRKLYKTIKD